MSELRFNGRIHGPEDLGTVNLDTGWKTIGTAFQADGVEWLGVFADVDINDSLNARMRVVANMSLTGDDYLTEAHKGGTGVILVGNSRYYEFNVDADQKQLLHFELGGNAPYAKVQVSAGTKGASPGAIGAIVYSV